MFELPDYSFLVLEGGVGLTFYGRTGEIQIHLPNKNDLKNWFDKDRRVFSGEIRFSNFDHEVFNLKQGGHVRIFDWVNYSHSPVMRIENVFRTPHIIEKISPAVFKPWLQGENLLEQLPFITGPGELSQHRGIINALFKVALSKGSFIVPFNELLAWTPMTPIMFTTPDAMYPWFEDLLDAKLITQTSKTVMPTSALIYLMMQAINRRKIMLGKPVFSY